MTEMNIEHPALVKEGMMRVAPLQGLPRVLSRFGLSPSALFEEAGLPTDVLNDPEATIKVEAAGRLLALCAKRTGCPHFGLLLGQDVKPTALGLIGLLAQNAVNVGSGLRGLILNLHLNGHAVVPALLVGSDVAELEFRLFPDLPGAREATIEFSMAVICSILRLLRGLAFAPSEVLFAHHGPSERAPYGRCFGAPVHFGRERNALMFPATWLGDRVHGANAASRAELEQAVATLAKRHQLPPEIMARRALFACIAFGDVSAGRVAAMTGLHHRTLNRRLADCGTSVFELTKDVRFQIARELLASTDLTVTEIAATLHYSHAGTFTRAFRLWSGSNPTTWRRFASQRHRPP
jgi:AraC-like DNA-binding protein